jgi:protein-disulfide isomerase
MDAAAFQQCIAIGKHRSGIDRDIEEATRFGVNGTPGFFINGRLISGAQTFESFARVINEELGSPGQKSATQPPK